MDAADTFRAAPDDSIERAVREQLESLGTLECDAPTATSALYFDSFDGRLHRAGARLTLHARNRLEFDDGAGRRWETRVETAPSFADDLAARSLRKRLKAMLSIRRLLPLVSMRVEATQWRLLNEDRKTIVRLLFERRSVRAPEKRDAFQPLDLRLTVQPLKGYDSDADAVRAALQTIETLEIDADASLEAPCRAVGVDLGGYSSKPKWRLESTLSSDQAVREILASLLKTMRQNERGIHDDLDIEFLHDFRVAVRRSRSCIGQMKGVLEPTALEPFRQELSWLGSVTGPTRDLDVFQLDLQRYQRDLGKESRDSLEPFAKLLAQDRQRAWKQLTQALKSDRYLKFVELWDDFLQKSDAATELGEKPIGALAGDRIRRRARKMLRDGRKLDAMNDGEPLHQLRIQGKKLRYLLEFFAHTLNDPKNDEHIATLKKLQDVLGTFNDLCVQQETLTALVPRVEGRRGFGPDAFVTIGRLLERLRQRETKTRRQFTDAFAIFTAGWKELG